MGKYKGDIEYEDSGESPGGGGIGVVRRVGGGEE